MNLVGGYGSDSESDVPSGPAAPNPAPLETKKLQQVAARKVKRLDISFLPPEIQAALTRGDSTNDSDDEGAGAGVSLNKQTSSSSANNDTGTKSKLLGLLPAPKTKEEPRLESTQHKSSAAERSDQQASSAAPKSSFVFGYATSSTTRVTKASDPAQDERFRANEKSETADAMEADEETPSLPWMQSSKSSSTTKVLLANSCRPFTVLSQQLRASLFIGAYNAVRQCACSGKACD
jgi:hypothetical protein